MKKIIIALLFFAIASNIDAIALDKKKLNNIKIEIFRNNKFIGHNNYFFKNTNNLLEVSNEIEFKVSLLGADIFKVSGKGVEKYKNGKLIFFSSKTLQNDKKKYVNLIYNKNKDEFEIDGSSFKGSVSSNSIVGNWWNHKIIKSEKQISPISGSIKDQIVKYIGEEIIVLYGKDYVANHFIIKSKDPNVPKNKKLDFKVWIDKKNSLILKVAYSRFGKWEYRLKSYN